MWRRRGSTVKGVPSRRARPCVREVRGHPVQDHSQAGQVQAVDEGAELVRGPVAGRGRIVAQHLVAPGGVQGMLHHGQQLHVGETQPGDVGCQVRGDLPVIHEGTAAAARSKVQLVDAERCMGSSPALFHPRAVAQA